MYLVVSELCLISVVYGEHAEGRPCRPYCGSFRFDVWNSGSRALRMVAEGEDALALLFAEETAVHPDAKSDAVLS